MTAPAQDAFTASLLRRARAPSSAHSILGLDALVSSLGDAQSLHQASTLTAQQYLIQQILATKKLLGLETDTNAIADQLEEHQIVRDAQGHSLERLLRELCDVYEARGGDDACESTLEQRHRSLLHATAVSVLTQRLHQASDEPQDSANALSVGEVCDELLQLSVSPTPAARALAFELFYQLVQSAAVHEAVTHHTSCPGTTLHDRLFGCFNDMLVKVIALSVGAPPSSTASSFHREWIRNAVTTLVLFTRSDSVIYRLDRVAKLNASTLVFLLRQAFTGGSYVGEEASIQEELLEIVIYTMYAQRGALRNGNGNPGRKSLPVDDDSRNGSRVTVGDVDRFGGVDLYLAVFYITPSDRSRRLLLVLFFDLAMEQVNQGKSGDNALKCSTDSCLLTCLQEANAAELLATSPLSFVGHVALIKVVKLVYDAVTDHLRCDHVQAVWSALLDVLRVEEYYVCSESLAHSLSLLADMAPQQQHDSLAELITNKCLTLIKSLVVEERFKGERWLAELLVFGLHKEAVLKEGSSAPTKLLAGGTSAAGTSGDALEETFCFDEDAKVRLCARNKLWELAKSRVEACRQSAASIIALFTRRQLAAKSTHAERIAHIDEMNQCLQVFIAWSECSASVLASLIECVLSVIVVHQVPYLDLHRQQYDADSCETPQELLGSLVVCETLPSKILCGMVSIDRVLLARVSIGFLVHALGVFDADDDDGRRGGSDAGDYGVVTALLLSHTLDEASSSDSLKTVEGIEDIIDARDERVAVIMARSLVALIKQKHGSVRFNEALRDLHTVALETDDEALVTNDIIHARTLVGALRL